MELWIRSQDEEDLLEVHNLGLAYKGKYGFMDKIGDIDGYCICEFINDYHVKLGTYATKERALEVLKEIQNLLIPKGIIKFNALLRQEDIKTLKEKLDDKYMIFNKNVELLQQYETLVYQMPKE